MDIRIFSCLFVKFVLYTAGFLGEGTLLILYRFYQGFSFYFVYLDVFWCNDSN